MQANQEPLTLKDVLISNAMSENYLWKIQIVEEDYPEEGKSQFLGMIKKFIIDFFKIEKGNTDELQALSKDFIRALRWFIKNIKIADNEFINHIIDQFSLFHNEIIDLQRDKALEIVSTTRQTFSFNLKVKRFVLSDLDLEHETNVFMTKVIQKKSLIFTEFVELFIASFKPFMIDYNLAVEKSLIEYIERVVNDFNHRFEKALAFTKTHLEQFLSQIIESVSPVRVTILMKEISQRNLFGPWIVCFERIFDKETIKLQQVVQLSPTSVMITLSFQESNKLITAISEQFIVSIIQTDLNDSSTILCQGSTRKDLLFIHNKLRQAFFAFERERKLEVKCEVKIFTEDIESITSAVLLRLSKEVLFVDNKGNLHFFSLAKPNANETSKAQIVPTLYRSIGLSSCGNFLFLCGKTETYVLNNKLEMVIQDFHVPDLTCLTNRSLLMLSEEKVEGVVIYRADINSDYVSAINVSDSLVERIDTEVRATITLGGELIEAIMDANRFVKFRPPEYNPR